MRKTIAFMTAAMLALPVGAVMADQGTKDQGTVQEMQHGRSAAGAKLLISDDIIGSKVKDKSGEELGSVKDLLASSDGKIDAAIIQLGGVLGVGGREVKVPWSSFALQRQADDPDELYLTASRQTLESAPAYDEDPRTARTTGDAPMNPAQ